MANLNLQKHELIEGNATLIVVDIQASTFTDDSELLSIDNMPDYKERIAIDAARKQDIPVIFIQEVHHPCMGDFGRELDGQEDVHCLEDNPATAIAVEEMDFRATDFLIRKRRYSAFFGTDFEILLKGLNVDTLILCGGLTDVCVHYTFVDEHQHDYFCRVIEDCTGGSSVEAHEYALRAMKYLQTGAVQSLDAVLDAMAVVKNNYRMQ